MTEDNNNVDKVLADNLVKKTQEENLNRQDELLSFETLNGEVIAADLDAFVGKGRVQCPFSGEYEFLILRAGDGAWMIGNANNSPFVMAVNACFRRDGDPLEIDGIPVLYTNDTDTRWASQHVAAPSVKAGDKASWRFWIECCSDGKLLCTNIKDNSYKFYIAVDTKSKYKDGGSRIIVPGSSRFKLN